MSDFSDRPFVAGSLTGLRAFDVDKYGRLCGPTYREVFKPGENVASCGSRSGGWATGRLVMPPGLTFHYYPTLGDDPTVPPPRKPKAEKPREKPKHVVGNAQCSCGFYAYFDGKNDYARTERVSAIIEGYGVCTVGDRGFRAEKAQLLGLIDNQPLPKWLLCPLVLLIFGVYNAVRFGFIVTDEGSATQVLTLFAAIACLAGAAFLLATGTPLTPRRNPLIAKVRKNYPDVPVYRTQRAALRAHPVTVPEGLVPTPNDEDFWTRPVTA